MQAITESPEKYETIPLRVMGYICKEPVLTRAYRTMIVTIQYHPLRRSLEDGQVRSTLRSRLGDLHAAGTCTDDRDPLAAEVYIMSPSCGVKERSSKRLYPLDLGNRRTVELPRGTDDGARGQLFAGPVGTLHGGQPVLRRVVPHGAQHGGGKLDPILQPEIADALFEVLKHLGLLGEIGGP